MANIFETAVVGRPSYNHFPLSHENKYTCRLGEMVPVATIECYPGDVFDLGAESLVRFLPLVTPVMHNMKVKTRAFFVPNRLLWAQWEDFITGKAEVEPPYFKPIDAGDPVVGSIGDYMDVPSMGATNIEYSAFPGAAYCLIYDEYFRHQYLQNTIFTPLVAGNNATAMATIFNKFSPYRVNWRKDYFTACMPWAQAGNPVTLPLILNDKLDVLAKDGAEESLSPGAIRRLDTGDALSDSTFRSNASEQVIADGTLDFLAYYDPQGSLYVDPNAEAVAINDLRAAIATQSFLEKLLRGGQRYIETIWALFGVRSQDARLQRPEYIFGSEMPVVVSTQYSTAQTVDQDDETIPIGQMAGSAIAAGRTRNQSYKCFEHGWIVILQYVTPETAYQQGLPRKYSRKTYLDYMFPDFAHLGEQAVLRKEIYATGVPGADDDDKTFGYMPRFEDLRFINNSVHGLMKTDFANWHMGRIFSSPPALNGAFIQSDPTDRIFAVQDPDLDQLVIHTHLHIDARRKLPKYGIPSSMGL